MKRCSKCGVERGEGEFYRDRRASDGLRSWCRECANDHHRNYTREAYHNPSHPAHARIRAEWKKGSAIANRRAKDPADSFYWTKREAAWRRLGIRNPDGSPFTRADFWEFWFEQKGACAMCGKLFGADFEKAVRKAQADHWHKKGKFGPARALLCWMCNKRVGDLTFETGKILWAYLSRFDPSRAPAQAPAHPPPHAPTREGA